MTAYVVASPVILPYKAAKWTYNKIKAGVNWIRNGYKKLKAKALGDPNLVAQDTKTAIKQASNEKKNFPLKCAAGNSCLDSAAECQSV